LRDAPGARQVTGLCDTADRIEAELKKLLR
jgi:hypothetical protein